MLVCHPCAMLHVNGEYENGDHDDAYAHGMEALNLTSCNDLVVDSSDGEANFIPVDLPAGSGCILCGEHLSGDYWKVTITGGVAA